MHNFLEFIQTLQSKRIYFKKIIILLLTLFIYGITTCTTYASIDRGIDVAILVDISGSVIHTYKINRLIKKTDGTIIDTGLVDQLSGYIVNILEGNIKYISPISIFDSSFYNKLNGHRLNIKSLCILPVGTKQLLSNKLLSKYSRVLVTNDTDRIRNCLIKYLDLYLKLMRNKKYYNKTDLPLAKAKAWQELGYPSRILYIIISDGQIDLDICTAETSSEFPIYNYFQKFTIQKRSLVIFPFVDKVVVSLQEFSFQRNAKSEIPHKYITNNIGSSVKKAPLTNKQKNNNLNKTKNINKQKNNNINKLQPKRPKLIFKIIKPKNYSHIATNKRIEIKWVGGSAPFIIKIYKFPSKRLIFKRYVYSRFITYSFNNPGKYGITIQGHKGCYSNVLVFVHSSSNGNVILILIIIIIVIIIIMVLLIRNNGEDVNKLFRKLTNSIKDNKFIKKFIMKDNDNKD